jgi:hypothetical protein
MTFSEIIVSYYQSVRKVPTRCEGNIQSFFSVKSDWVYLSRFSNEIKNLAQFCTPTKQRAIFSLPEFINCSLYKRQTTISEYFSFLWDIYKEELQKYVY